MNAVRRRRRISMPFWILPSFSNIAPAIARGARGNHVGVPQLQNTFELRAIEKPLVIHLVSRSDQEWIF
jgi:hypothetical protein